jgi:hypothetical protein
MTDVVRNAPTAGEALEHETTDSVTAAAMRARRIYLS